MLRKLIALTALLWAIACHDGPFGEPDSAEAALPATTTIAELHRLVGQQPVGVTGDIAVSGLVTTTDRRFGFYHMLCIESDGAALALLAGIDRLHVDYPVGCRVTLRLQGLTLGFYRGVLQDGTAAEPGSYYPTGYLASPAAVAARLFRSDEALQPIVPVRRRIGELTTAQCGTLIRIDGLTALPDGEAATWSGTHAFCDDAGQTVYSYVRSGALFADAAIPAGRCSLTGILLCDNGRYLIQLRDEEDIIQ